MKQQIFRPNVGVKAHKMILRIAEKLRRLVSENRQGDRGIKRIPRARNASGGLQLGVDLPGTAALYEHDDLQDIRRINWRARQDSNL
jgi:hypothetical protein